MNLRGQRIHEAQRIGLRNRVRDEWHLLEERADALVDAWDQEAMNRFLTPGDAAYWRDGEAWIRERVDARRSHAEETEG
jgi:hypothetical protein